LEVEEMKKFVKEYKSGCPRFEVTTIEGSKATHEYLFPDKKAVWKEFGSDIIKDYKWSDVKEYIKWLKKLGFMELKAYKDNLTWEITATGQILKRYEF
jgi:hypothetical protein